MYAFCIHKNVLYIQGDPICMHIYIEGVPIFIYAYKVSPYLYIYIHKGCPHIYSYIQGAPIFICTYRVSPYSLSDLYHGEDHKRGKITCPKFGPIQLFQQLNHYVNLCMSECIVVKLFGINNII